MDGVTPSSPCGQRDGQDFSSGHGPALAVGADYTRGGEKRASELRRRSRAWFRWLRAGWLTGTGFIILSLFIAAAVILYVQQQTGDAVVRRALRIEIALADVLASVQQQEIAVRGYILTGNDGLLRPIEAAGKQLAGEMAELSSLISRIDGLSEPFARLRGLVAAKQEESMQSIALHQLGRMDDTRTRLQAGAGDRVLVEIRQLITVMDAREDAVVERRQAQLRRLGLLVAASITMAVILLGFLALAAIREVLRRSELARFLPSEVVHRLAAGDISLRRGREVQAAVAFVDIRGSTELAERLEVGEFSALLCHFRGAVLAATEASGGLVDKFIGDGALVVFGVHDPTTAAAAQAIRFARELRHRHDALQERMGSSAFAIVMGIHYGPTFCGIVGTAGRLEFTVLGDTVNVAAKLEDEAKAHGVDLLVSGAVLHHAGERPDAWQAIACPFDQGRRVPLGIFTDRGAGASPVPDRLTAVHRAPAGECA